MLDGSLHVKIEVTTHTSARFFYYSVSQSEIFQCIGLPLISDLINGNNNLLFAYGVTGSGMTHLMVDKSTGWHYLLLFRSHFQ